MAVLRSRIRGQRGNFRLHLEFAVLTTVLIKNHLHRNMRQTCKLCLRSLWPIISPRKWHHCSRRPYRARGADCRGITENRKSFLRQTVNRAAAESMRLKMLTRGNGKAWKSTQIVRMLDQQLSNIRKSERLTEGTSNWSFTRHVDYRYPFNCHTRHNDLHQGNTLI